MPGCGRWRDWPFYSSLINMMAYATLSPDSNNQASSMLALMRNLGGGGRISVLVTLLLNALANGTRSPLIAHTSPVDPGVAGKVIATDASMGDSQAALAVLDGRLWQQAQLLAYSEGFQLMALMFFLLVPLVWWLNPFPRPPVQG